MKKLIPLILLMVMLSAGCDLSGISITTGTQPVISSFSASPASIAAGASSTLDWSVTGATKISIDQGIGNVALTGSRAVMPGTTTVYTLTASNAAGVSVTATAQVLVTGSSTPPSPTPPTTSGPPVINYFTATPPEIYSGGSAILSWDVTNATSTSINHGVGAVSISGKTVVSPGTTTVYTLTATNSAGDYTRTATVYVSGVPPQSFGVTSVTASAVPPSFSGTCPTTFNFSGAIAVSGPGTVIYRWESSDAGAEPMQSINFLSAGLQEVSTSRQLGTTGSYWERLHVFTPNEIISNQANFTLSCKLLMHLTPLTWDWSGTWSTTYGMMHLTQTGNQVTGTYEHSNGHIAGTVSGNVITGTWSEAPTYTAPDNAGDVQLTISSDGKTFTGGWRYGSSGSWTMNWNGTTIF
jgi:hypothetical protein